MDLRRKKTAESLDKCNQRSCLNHQKKKRKKRKWGPLKGDLILLTESDIFKIWTKTVQMYHIKAQISKRLQLFVRSTTDVQRRRNKGRLTVWIDMSCTFTVRCPAEDNPTKETAQYDKHTASGVNQTSRLKNILHLKKEKKNRNVLKVDLHMVHEGNSSWI